VQNSVIFSRVLNYIKRDLVVGSPLIYYSATDMAPCQPHVPKVVAAPIAVVTSPILAPALVIPISVAAFTNPH
jgi:hypothetical protein